MNVLLLTDHNLGKKGDIVSVADGYATSALIPQGIASPATPEMIAQQKRLQQKEHAQQKIQKQLAQKTAQQLTGKTISITAKATNGKLFGSIGAHDVAQAIKAEYNIDIPHDALNITHIKKTGTHDLSLDLGFGNHCKMRLRITEA